VTKFGGKDHVSTFFPFSEMKASPHLSSVCFPDLELLGTSVAGMEHFLLHAYRRPTVKFSLQIPDGRAA
jgi:hypothetical protein